VDISVENIIGGKVGHEIGARERLLSAFAAWNLTTLKKQLTERSPALRAAQWIVEHNIMVGNMLPLDAVGKSTGRNAIPIIEYTFRPDSLCVALFKTTLGDVIEAAHAEVAVELSLFGPKEPTPLWEGKALELSESEKVAAPKLRGPARNGKGVRK
jgi:hypothetical protein